MGHVEVEESIPDSFFSNFFIAFDYRYEDNKNKRTVSMNIFFYSLFLKDEEETFDLL